MINLDEKRGGLESSIPFPKYLDTSSITRPFKHLSAIKDENGDGLEPYIPLLEYLDTSSLTQLFE